MSSGPATREELEKLAHERTSKFKFYRPQPHSYWILNMLLSGAGKNTVYRVKVVIELFFTLPLTVRQVVLDEINDESSHNLTEEELKRIHTLACLIMRPERRIIGDGSTTAYFISFPFKISQSEIWLGWARDFAYQKYGDISDGYNDTQKLYLAFRDVGLTESSYLAFKSLFETWAMTRVNVLIPYLLKFVKFKPKRASLR